MTSLPAEPEDEMSDGSVFCTKCGEKNRENNYKCTRCGEHLHAVPTPVVVANLAIGEDKTMRYILPVGRSGWAIASGYLGLISVLILPAPLAVLTGLLAVREIRRNPAKLGMGRAIFGIVLGTLGSLAMVAILISS
ncbi:DUF4190 domain-containing protein [Candidatus Saccharibacteria bacterium]|nr:DUF4190 domain-containing protein [Candidatus Saccharibacteria bacterium]